MQTSSPIQTNAPSALWRIARAFLDVLFTLFGAPEDVAASNTLTRTAHYLLASWLRVGEAMMRRLIAIEAAAYENDHTPAPPRAAREHQRCLREFWPDQPEAWRVSFQCIAPSSSARGGGQRAAIGVRARFLCAWPLAERYEALLRAFNDPGPLARRLARRLHAAPERLDALLAAPEEYAHRIDRAEDFTDLARAAWPSPDSS